MFTPLSLRLKTLSLFLPSLLFFAETALAEFKPPRLAVVLVIDQFRADYLLRFANKFLPPNIKHGALGGFRYLTEKGAYFPYGQYSLLQSMTGPGHATILSGSYPYQAGIPLNFWYDSESKRKVYCAEDSNSPLITSSVEASTEAKRADPTGRSPKNFIGTTVGDEMKNAGYPGRVVALALKDRSAIFLGGHRADVALWLDAKSHEWVSSRHYLPGGDLPTWIQKLNCSIKPLFAKLKTKGNNLNTPFGLEITEQAAEAAVRELGLGSVESPGQSPGSTKPHTHTPTKTDLLAISFSSHDTAGHQFGPNSPEMEAMTLAEDRLISHFLNFLKNHLPNGLQDVVFVLTGDHGIPPHPDWLKGSKIPTGRISGDALVEALSIFLDEKFGKPSQGRWVVDEEDFNFYLNQAAITAKGLERAKIEGEAKAFLAKTPGIAHVITHSDYLNRKLPPGIFETQILHTYYPGRSGDLILIPKPFFMDMDPKSKGVTHVTGYTYDRTVPIIFAGPQIKAGTYLNSVEVVDIAPTLSWLLRVLPPSLSEGRVLTEVLKSSGGEGFPGGRSGSLTQPLKNHP